MGAGRAIEAMKSEYKWLDPYIQEVTEAAEAEAAFEPARDAAALEEIVVGLRKKAMEARRDKTVPASVSSADEIVRTSLPPAT